MGGTKGGKSTSHEWCPRQYIANINPVHSFNSLDELSSLFGVSDYNHSIQSYYVTDSVTLDTPIKWAVDGSNRSIVEMIVSIIYYFGNKYWNLPNNIVSNWIFEASFLKRFIFVRTEREGKVRRLQLTTGHSKGVQSVVCVHGKPIRVGNAFFPFICRSIHYNDPSDIHWVRFRAIAVAYRSGNAIPRPKFLI